MKEDLLVPARVLAVAAAGGAVTTIAFWYRMDHTAHLLAGVGLVTVVAALVAVLGWTGPSALAGSVAAVVAASWLSELTVFGPRVDVADALYTVVGAVLGAAAVSGRLPAGRGSVGLFVVGLALVGAGLVVRYQLQYPFSEWWYTV